jgi:hypothetical protein
VTEHPLEGALPTLAKLFASVRTFCAPPPHTPPRSTRSFVRFDNPGSPAYRSLSASNLMAASVLSSFPGTFLPSHTRHGARPTPRLNRSAASYANSTTQPTPSLPLTTCLGTTPSPTHPVVRSSATTISNYPTSCSETASQWRSSTSSSQHRDDAPTTLPTSHDSASPSTTTSTGPASAGNQLTNRDDSVFSPTHTD